MKLHHLSLCVAVLCLFYGCSDGKTVFRRTDKISENFKQLNLPAEEIDPNVAPPEPQKIETIDPEDVVGNTSGSTDSQATVEEAVEADSAAATNEVLDESVNEIDSADPVESAEPAAAAAVDETPVSTAAAAAAPATPAAATTTTAAPAVSTTETPLSKYCKCTEDHCDCCRNFNLPLIPVRGPGCAKITYLGNEKMSVSLKYGDITLATRTISSKNSRPLCVGLPGGYSKFCGRVYGLSKAKDNFKACLGFELRADDEVEAALRVSCFKFGPQGLKVAEAEPFPVNKDEEEEDDDIFGFAAGGDEEDEEDDYDDTDDDEADEPDDSIEDDDVEEAPEDADYGGFSLGDLFDELDDDDEPAKPATTAVTTVAAGITPPTAVDATRVASEPVEAVQSKVDKDTAALPAETTASAVGETVDAATAAAAATAEPATTATSESKPTKTRKSKKSKKKKAVSDVETDFAYELLNGILDFFN